MPNSLYNFVLSVNLCFVLPIYGVSAVTYEQSESRFGDQLQLYLHAKWLSYQHKISLLYKPFVHAEAFALSETEEPWALSKELSFLKFKRYEVGETIRESVLYDVPYFSECTDDVFHPMLFTMDWNDQEFISLLKKAFAPKQPPPRISFPLLDNLITVALHVRTGRGYDPGDPHMIWPLRFAPISFYVESVRIVASKFIGKSLYVYVFTDDPDPLSIVSTLQQALADLPIEIDCRQEGNHHRSNIIEDFFSMMDFDCLIRSTSNYSLIPAMIGEYKMVISPKHHRWQVHGNVVENYIDEKLIRENLTE